MKQEATQQRPSRTGIPAIHGGEHVKTVDSVRDDERVVRLTEREAPANVRAPKCWLPQLPRGLARGAVSAVPYANARRPIQQLARLPVLTASQMPALWGGADPTCAVRNAGK